MVKISFNKKDNQIFTKGKTSGPKRNEITHHIYQLFIAYIMPLIRPPLLNGVGNVVEVQKILGDNKVREFLLLQPPIILFAIILCHLYC